MFQFKAISPSASTQTSKACYTRPRPDCFTPPNGATSVDTVPVLMPTIPLSMASATRQIPESADQKLSNELIGFFRK
jgi:hypothetical protein